MDLAGIERLEEKLAALVYVRQFSELLTEAYAGLQAIDTACRAVTESKTLRRVLACVLRRATFKRRRSAIHDGGRHAGFSPQTSRRASDDVVARGWSNLARRRRRTRRPTTRRDISRRRARRVSRRRVASRASNSRASCAPSREAPRESNSRAKSLDDVSEALSRTSTRRSTPSRPSRARRRRVRSFRRTLRRISPRARGHLRESLGLRARVRRLERRQNASSVHEAIVMTIAL